eukprot:GCRY01003856.1.p1 GENE.GCRY01003856.1~~GCRY01003856.1.p1  ORF type:complete len:389 (+),score=73.70 GCRY01003856.1:105-1169(+)
MKADVVLFTFISNGIISLVAVFGIVFIVLLNKRVSISKLQINLLALSAGTLLGGAFLHLLPHIFLEEEEEEDDSGDHVHHDHEEEEHSHDHNHTTFRLYSAFILIGFLVCFLMERVSRLKPCEECQTAHSNEVVEPTELAVVVCDKPVAKNDGEKKEMKSKQHSQKELITLSEKSDASSENLEPVAPASAEQPQPPAATNRSVATVIAFGDGIHNFFDGAAIAASFLEDPVLGWVTTIAVALHELPQELGDAGILLHHCHLSPKFAILLNLLSSLTAFVGAAITLLIAEASSEVNKYFISISCGTFLYLGGTIIMPVMLEEKERRSALQQIIMLFVGLGLIACCIPLESLEHDH